METHSKRSLSYAVKLNILLLLLCCCCSAGATIVLVGVYVHPRGVFFLSPQQALRLPKAPISFSRMRHRRCVFNKQNAMNTNEPLVLVREVASYLLSEFNLCRPLK